MALARANRSLDVSVRHALGEVRYRVVAATLLHEDFARVAVGRALPWPSPCSDGPGRASGRDRRGTLRRERGTRRLNVRDSVR
jgi:hypothetical protein